MRLVVDTSFRERAAGDPVTTFDDPDLTPIERRRLAAVAKSEGLPITVMLHRGWRLGKLLTLLPGTCRLLGPDRLAQQLSDFWRGRLPDSLYFHDEALAFASHVADRDELLEEVPGLRDMLDRDRRRLEEAASVPVAGAGSH
jgi:hypothetical protein